MRNLDFVGDGLYRHIDLIIVLSCQGFESRDVTSCSPPGRTMTLGLIQLNRNEYQKMFLGSRARPQRKADKFTAICEPTF
jgi:hypothetical protein